MKNLFLMFEDIMKSLNFANNVFNLSSKTSLNKEFFEEDDQLALADDWRAVGEEVQTAIDKYGESLRGRSCRISGR